MPSEPAEFIPCPQCGRTFHGVKGLATQCRSKHGAPQVIPGQTCPRVPENILHSQQHDVPSPSALQPTGHITVGNPAHISDTSNTIRTMVISTRFVLCTGSASTVLSFPSVVGAMSTDPETPTNAQCAVESGGLAAFLRDTAVERARDVHAFQEAALSEFHRHTGFDVDDTDRSTSANQVPVSVLTCWSIEPVFVHTCATSRPCSSQGVTIRSHATNTLHTLASAHVRSSGYAGASDETGAAATEDHATARTRASEPSSASRMSCFRRPRLTR